MDWNKEEVVGYCLKKCRNRVQEIQSAMDSAQDAILNDTKSSMGDKYETSREMAQQEISRLQNQLKQAEIDLDKINNLDLNSSELVRMGSIVQTDQFDYFIAISIGAVKIKEKTIMIISKESPIGNLLFGKKEKETVQFNNKTITIQKIY
ncbi:hypothetical protein SMI01S_25350 [Sphingobacterium mizutaii NBRC 14946 = DSM 11724]|uniref:Transcription elongation factor n=2 Tax=Sphingobacterium mizutaii TaxID=1010 RepID=A0AAJ4XBI0_9SPHI|nr:hypothetical protein [Sphingobacterium mizutaii]GEM68929.1 hypothetical protein SMI01S_25350 [Sphingobacterium mizutaii NBRC 14946 = DSM 11724]SDL02922.1 hypothetical protein SAMN05192578_101925 [Sphingobacterium mizutaii]SNV50386.1 Transcription elongation factor [Sphingobacterium mizutaii]